MTVLSFISFSREATTNLQSQEKIIFALTISLHTPSMLYEKADSTTGNCFANIRLYIAGLRNNGIDLSIWHNQDVLMYGRDDLKL